MHRPPPWVSPRPGKLREFAPGRHHHAILGPLSDRIGRFEIRSLLGQGAFATVYEAFDPRLESVVAVKLLADNWSHEPEVRARFRQEAVLMRRVHTEHPAAPLVDVYDIDETPEGRPYFVMRLAEHGSLADRVAGAGPQPASAVVPVVEVVAEALAVLHAAGIVHRDVKPSNLLIAAAPAGRRPGAGELLAPGERLLLGDLGLAKDLLISGSALTMAGGTPRFMAPEQRDPAAAIDHRADLYAATAVIADLVTGSPTAPAPGSQPPMLAAALERGLAVDPADRFPDAGSWSDALRAALAAPPAVANSPDVGRGARPVVVASVLALLAALAVAVAIALAVAVVGWRSWTGGGDADEIVGPRTVTVGDTVTLTADVDDGDHYTWVVGGRRVDDLDLELQPDRSGFVVVELEITDPEGGTETVAATITVSE